MAVDFLAVSREKRDLTYAEIYKHIPDKEPKGHYDAVREYPLRKGKGIRPTFLLLACEAWGGDPAKALKTAAAMQLSEDWLLVHDDFEDHSDERRGKPALQKIYGDEIAVNAGDALHLLQWKVLSENFGILDEKTIKRVFDKMCSILLTTAEGQFIEMDAIRKQKMNFTEEDFYRIADGKAGWYTVIGPIQLGAIIAGADDKTLDKIAEVGLPAGRAFQIQDDVLNVAGDVKKYGKEIGGDILEGKRTLMFAHLMKNCTPDERRRVAEIYSKRREDKTEDEKMFVIKLMKKTGSIEYARQKSREFAETAKKAMNKHFSKLPGAQARDALLAGLEFIVSRDH